MLDNAGHQDGKKPVTSAGSNYALHAPAKDVTRPLGEWNEARIRVKGAHVDALAQRHQAARVRPLDAGVEGAGRGQQVQAMPGYGLEKTGHIALQDHGNDVKFRNIRIRAL